MAATGFSLGEDSDEEVIIFLFPFSNEKDSNLSELCVLCQFDPDSDFGATKIFLSVLLHPSGQYYFRHRVYFKMQHIRFIPFQKLFLCYQKKPYLQTAPGSLLRFIFKEEKVIPPTATLLERYKPAM